jgi:hypothetical protein
MPALTQSAREYEQRELLKENIALENAMLERQKKLQDISKAESETLSGRAGQADIAASVLEQARQKRRGVEIGKEVGAEMLEKGGPSILEATKKQAGIDLDLAREQARLGAVEQYMVEKGLTPTAKIDMGGISATVPFASGGEKMADSYSQIYRSMVPRLSETYQAEGFDRDTSIRMASDQVRKELVKASSSGKVVLMGAGGGTISYSNEQAMKMWKDPSTPKSLKAQLDEFFGPSETPRASNWVNTRLGR